MTDATPTDPSDPSDPPGSRKASLAELHHRTRNLLALVRSIVHRTVASSASLEDFGSRIEARLGALGRAQRLVAKSDHQEIDLAELVGAELVAHDGGGTQRARVEGPPVAVPPAFVQPLTLALHELVANAAEHGALGQPGGRLAVTWDVEEDREGNGDGVGHGAGRRVRLAWREGGVVMPDGGGSVPKGYGSELIERALPYQLKATTRLELGPDGVLCEVVFDPDGVGQVSRG